MNAASASELIIQGNATHTSTGIQLTPAEPSQFGGLYINGISFSPINGLHVEFEYDMKGGTSLGGSYGDGLSFFLYDGSITSPSIGSPGAGLGYTYNRTNEQFSNLRKAGLTGAYLGIALDQFGNFKYKRFQAESRVNGIQRSSFEPIENSHVTLRGAKGQTLTNLTYMGLGEGFAGYPVLITRSTLTNTATSGKVLQSDGTFANTTNTLSSTFSLRNTNNEFRKVYLDLIPHFETPTFANGFDVKVDIQTDADTPPINVINYYHYKTSVFYYENANPAETDYNNDIVESSSFPRNLNTTVPSVLKLGFAASTGQSYQEHIIKNVKLTLPYSAVTNDDEVSTCKNQSVQIPVFDNDIAYKGPISITIPPTGSKDNIDYKTFSFTKNSDTDLTLYRKKTTPQGTWSFNTNTGIVTFTPSNGFTGTSTMTYSIKGRTVIDLLSGKIIEPYGDTAYRSVPSTITVKLENIGCNVKSNRMVSQGIK
ncbi:hypothetical protein [Chryseobacterium oryctis]|uniref:Uncharacterized protein n=1 Tax=Chryseobacterium oryctis TaxID=2952618 RepID=A0ABT3HJG0_9FLAO|nr:hypothetical protein [Chryseobacterium oryctis]MCW3159896.1 hypothetical protein [Chryseobacterium oryctis]